MRTFASRMIAIAFLWFCRLLMIPSLADADEPVGAQTIEFLPASTIKLHEFVPDTLGPYEPRELGFYRRGADKLHFLCDFSGSIIKEGSVEDYYMFCNVRLDTSTQSALHAAGTRPIPFGITHSGFGSYVFRQGVIYPMPYGELYRVEDLTRSDEQGQYALLKQVTRKELGIDAPLDYSRLYIPIRWKDDVIDGGSLGESICRFWYAEEPNRYTKKLETALKCSQRLPVVFVMREKQELPPMASMIVEEGTVLPVLDCGFKILKIVPPNVEKKVCGWVEIDPRPILLRTPLGRELEKLEQQEQQKAAPQPTLAPIPDPKP